MDRTYSYRNGWIFFVAFWCGGFGLLFSWMALKAMSHPMPAKLSNGVLLTNGAAAWLPVFMPALAFPIGVWLFLFALNSKVVMSEDGLRIYNWSKRLTLFAPWDEIVSVQRGTDFGGGYNLTIQTASRSEVVTHSLIDIDDLEHLLCERLGPERVATHQVATT